MREKYRRDLLPKCLAVGMTASEFWSSYPCEITPYFEAHRLRLKAQDELNYFGGVYTFEAVSVSLANAFRKKNTRPIEYRKKPILSEMEVRPMTEEELAEKQEREQKLLFHRLEIARFNQEYQS